MSMTPGEAVYSVISDAPWEYPDGEPAQQCFDHDEIAQVAIDAHEAYQWRLESDRPELGAPVLVCYSWHEKGKAGMDIDKAKWDGSSWEDPGGLEYENVTHWRELPKPPTTIP